MPVLDLEELQGLRSRIKQCPECTNFELSNYCRQCDEFFVYGHDDNCRLNPHQHEKHDDHRTY